MAFAPSTCTQLETTSWEGTGALLTVVKCFISRNALQGRACTSIAAMPFAATPCLPALPFALSQTDLSAIEWPAYAPLNKPIPYLPCCTAPA